MKLNSRFFVLTIIYIALYSFISTLGRDQFGLLFTVYTVLFGMFFYGMVKRYQYYVYQYVIVFLVLRIPFFFNLPELSDDFYRFLWDGMLLNEGINPWGRIPIKEELVNFRNPEMARTLLENMNSAAYASVYPSVNQIFFGIAYFFAGNSILNGVNVIRAGIVLVELSFYLFMVFRNPKERRVSSVYLLCPLTIIEGVGNLHFEAVAVPLMAIALSEFVPSRYFRVAIPWSVSVATKLLPLILGPMLFYKFPKRRRYSFLIVSSISIFLLLALIQPWASLSNLGSGLGLYFRNFEFNASIYYLVRVLLEPAMGYNPIAYIGPALGIIAAIIILFISYTRRKANIMELGLVIFTIYYLFSTTVHPWYLLPVVFFALCSGRVFILVWAYAVWLSYTHYLGDLGPKWWALLIEYGLLAAAIVMETRKKKWLQPAFLG